MPKPSNIIGALTAGSVSAITRIDIFHRDCPKWNKESGPVPYFEVQDDEDSFEVLSQLYLKCDHCGTRLHIDVWPHQTIHPENWKR